MRRHFGAFLVLAAAAACTPPPEPSAGGGPLPYDPAIQRIAPFAIFDDLYYVGIQWVSAYLLVTPGGLVLIDSLHGEFADHTLEGIRALGFDPADLRYVLVTHGHFDHAGGARHVQERTGARVGMTEQDWRLAATDPGEDWLRFEAPERDLVLADGDVLELGGKAIRCYVTPGHTPGVLSLGFTVHDGESPHEAFVFGGAGLNFQGVARTEAYIASVERILGFDALDVNLSNHPGSGRILERSQTPRDGARHPFVDPAAFRTWLRERLDAARQKLIEETGAGRP